MTKQEAIKQAVKKHYGRYYEFVEDHHDEWGWVNEKWLEHTDFKSNVEYGRYADLIKPIALNGIEENNGWVFLEINNLPKDGTKCLFIISGYEEVEHIGHYEDGLFWEGKAAYTARIITHYYPIVKPEKPIW